MAWKENGPVSIPSGAVLALAAFFVAGAAVGGAGLGFQAGWRDGGHSAIGAADTTDDTAQAIVAKPLVDLPPPVQQAAATAPAKVAANAAEAADSDNDDADDSNDIAVKTATAQAVQSRPGKTPPDIDDIYTSQSEKPQPPAKPSTDEGAPGAGGGAK